MALSQSRRRYSRIQCVFTQPQSFGGQGLTEKTPVARRHQDGRFASILGGADEIMLEINARQMECRARRDRLD
ncbi:acyl-CoA dehydrogenase family protein [Variovorax paradoxus]|uniref:acyl-CoA dehydrogenase family protein n=1 Tax=Variovorax paradoxus TaxID=34073 RepID=UPI003AAA2EF0